jgi:hypothetical protein
LPQPFFKEITSAGLNSLRQNDYQISVKNRIFFNDPFHKKGSLLVILEPGMIQPSGSRSFFGEIGILRLLRPVRLQRLMRPMRLKKF